MLFLHTLRPRVQTPGGQVEAHGIEKLGKLVADPISIVYILYRGSHLTWLSSGQVLHDIVHGVSHMIVPGDIHVDEPQEGRTLHSEPLCTLRTCVQTPGEHMEAHGIEVLGELMADPGVASRDEDGFGADVVLGLAQHGPQQVGQEGHGHAAHYQQLDEQHVLVRLHRRYLSIKNSAFFDFSASIETPLPTRYRPFSLKLKITA